jgi:hypothetical protein
MTFYTIVRDIMQLFCCVYIHDVQIADLYKRVAGVGASPQNNQTDDAISSVLKAAIGLKADSEWVEENLARY